MVSSCQNKSNYSELLPQIKLTLKLMLMLIPHHFYRLGFLTEILRNWIFFTRETCVPAHAVHAQYTRSTHQYVTLTPEVQHIAGTHLSVTLFSLSAVKVSSSRLKRLPGNQEDIREAPQSDDTCRLFLTHLRLRPLTR